MADVKWIKITTDVFDDEKILLIESMPSADSIIVIWFKLLTFAGKQNNNGVFMMSNRIAYTDEMLASIFRRDIKIVRLALDTFMAFGMIEIIENVITIPNWNKHQTLDAYEKKKERDRLYQAERRATQKALIEKSSDKSSDVAISEEDREEDKEKEILSISLARAKETLLVDNFVDDEDNEAKAELRAQQRNYMRGDLGEGLIFMSDDQWADICERYSLDEIHYYFEVIKEQIRKGHRYRKTHYQAFIDMAEKDRKKR